MPLSYKNVSCTCHILTNMFHAGQCMQTVSMISPLLSAEDTNGGTSLF